MNVEASLSKAAPGSGPAVDFSGKWINELKSTMTLVQSNDSLSGSYESAKSADGTVTKGKLVGFADGDVISFTVHWDEYQAITAWVGQLDGAKSRLDTLWQMASQADAGEEWNSINAGADQFTRVP